MNERMKKMLLSTAGTLSAVLILCAVLVPPNYRVHAMVMASVTFIVLLYYRLKKSHKKDAKERQMQVIDMEPDYKKLYAQQIQQRVQERLKEKFPSASVELCEKDILQIAASGKCIYVPIKKAEHYSHMSVSIGRNGEIQMNLFSLVNLEQVHREQITIAEEENREVDRWYSQRGQKMLTELITNMHSRGYTKLSISESGDVTVKENGRSVLKDHFKEIPPKDQWARLKELMAEDDVQMQVSGRRLTLAW